MYYKLCIIYYGKNARDYIEYFLHSLKILCSKFFYQLPCICPQNSPPRFHLHPHLLSHDEVEKYKASLQNYQTHFLALNCKSETQVMLI